MSGWARHSQAFSLSFLLRFCCLLVNPFMGRVVPHPRTVSSPSDAALIFHSFLHHDASHNAQLPSHKEPELHRSSSAQHPAVHVGATGSIFSLLDRDVPALPRVVEAAAVDLPSTSWLDRPWMRSSRRRSSNGRDNSEKKKDGAQQRLETVTEAEFGVPNWIKRLLRKLMRDAKSKSDGSKGSRTDENSANGNGQRTRVKILAEKQLKCKPLSTTKCSDKPANLLWERRNVAPIAALDLRQLKAARAKRYTRRAVR